MAVKAKAIGAGTLLALLALAYFVLRAKAAPPVVYTCPHCGAEFATYEELQAHIELMHPEEPIPPEVDIPEGFTISDLAFIPETTAIGYPVTISAMATNVSNPEGVQDFLFHINGEILTTTTFYWTIGETREVSVTYTPAEVRTYQVRIANLEGSFTATELPDVMLLSLPMETLSPVSSSPGGRIRYYNLTIEPSTVRIGEDVIISVIVANHYSGGTSAGVTCTMRNIAIKQKMGLSGGERVLVSFQATPYVAKTFSVIINKGARSEMRGKFTAIL